MKRSYLLLASLAWFAVALPAMAHEVKIRNDCDALLSNLGNCNGQTPDTARLACQEKVCENYAACLSGPNLITPIPTLAKLCSGVVAPVPTSSLAITPTPVTPVR